VGLWGYTALSSSGAESCRVSVCIGKPWLAPALLTASAVGGVLLGGAILMLRGDRPAGPAGAPAGPAVALTAGGAVVAAAGGAGGSWMSLIGIGIAAVGAAGVVAARRRRS
jgi:LPXTG-motif cell wall-anchored protein